MKSPKSILIEGSKKRKAIRAISESAEKEKRENIWIKRSDPWRALRRRSGPLRCSLTLKGRQREIRTKKEKVSNIVRGEPGRCLMAESFFFFIFFLNGVLFFSQCMQGF